jgi:tungstate transport system ATP-binding protein
VTREADRGVAGTPLVEIRDLVVRRGPRTVLDVERLEIGAGETLAVVGPNGAGKSTLLLVLARLIAPEAGTLSFRGARVERADELAYRRRIGLVLADPLLLGASVFANVAAGLRFRGVPDREVRARVVSWLDRLGIAYLADRPARQISSGEGQRAALARAFVLEPDLLLLDEPFASVDPATRAKLLDDLDDLLRATRVACVMVTHDLDEAVRIGDRLAVLLDGRVRQVGAPETVLGAPVDAEVAAFVGTETRIPGWVVASEGGLATVAAGEHRIEAVSTLGPGAHVLCCLRPEDVTIWTDPAADRGSARNRLPGRVVRLVPDGPLVRVTLDCGVLVVAAITRASAGEMGLVEGGPAVATFKAAAVHLIHLAT